MVSEGWLPEQQHQHFARNEHSWVSSRPSKWESLGAVPAVCKHSRWFWGMLGCEHHWCKPPSCSVSSDLSGDLAFKLQHAPLIQTSSGMHDCHSSLSIHPGQGLRHSRLPWWRLCCRVLVIELVAARRAFGIQLPDLWFFSSSPRWRIENRRGEWLGVARGKARGTGVRSSGWQPWLRTGVIRVFWSKVWGVVWASGVLKGPLMCSQGSEPPDDVSLRFYLILLTLALCSIQRWGREG